MRGIFILGRISVHGYLWIARQIQDIFLPLRNLHLQDTDCWNRHSHKWNGQDYRWCDWHPNRLKQRDLLLHGIKEGIVTFFCIVRKIKFTHFKITSTIATRFWTICTHSRFRAAKICISSAIVRILILTRYQIIGLIFIIQKLLVQRLFCPFSFPV